MRMSGSSAPIIMHELFSLIPSSGELGVIFIPYKLHLEALNNFPCIFPSWTSVCVFTVLSFHITCFCLAFILRTLTTGSSVFLYLFWLFRVFIFVCFSFPSLLMVTSSWSFLSWFVMVFPLRPFSLSYGYLYFSSLALLGCFWLYRSEEPEAPK